MDQTANTSKTLGQIGLENFPTYLMNRIMGRYNERLQGEMKRLGLSTPKMRALAVLSALEAPSIGKLAVYSVVENSTLSRALDAMEQDGQIVRKVDEKDGRTIRISLTEKGRSAFTTIWPTMHQNYEAMFDGIDDAERHAFTGTLQKILRNIRVHNY